MLKIFQMNDYEWYATDGTKEELNDWYNKNIAENDISEVVEMDLDKEGMWYSTEDIEDIGRLGDADEIGGVEITNGGLTYRKTRIGDLMRTGGEIYKYISYREALEKQGYNLEDRLEEPYCIATTDW